MSSLSALDRLRRWISGASTPGSASAPSPQAEATAKSGAHAGGLRQQRAGRREQLFTLVRENMIRMGVLSSHYKFKVLTLDPAGEQFIVMVDWQPGALSAGPAFEQPFEAALQHLLVERQQGFKVKAVYWRGHAEAGASATASASLSASLPTSATQARPARAAPVPSPPSALARAVPAGHPPPGDHVSDDELKALQEALRQAGARPAAAPSTPRRAPATDFPDFEPTINTEGQPGTEFGALSETQYGKLS